MKALFEEHELPKKDLESLGLYKDGEYKLSPEDLQTLLAGRRTDMLTLYNTNIDGLSTFRIDLKISAYREDDGKVNLKAHPIYKEPLHHGLFEKEDFERMLKGTQANVAMQFTDKETGKKINHIYEYDPETRDFVAYSPKEVQVPESVDNNSLTKDQKEAFRNGLVVTLDDGTKIQHSAVQRNGMLANKAALIASFILDGGISYLLITGIRFLKDKLEQQRAIDSPGYAEAYKEFQKSQEGQKFAPAQQNEDTEQKISIKRGSR